MMKKFAVLSVLAALVAVGLTAGQAYAQANAASFVTQTGNRPDAATLIGTSVSSAATITMTPNPGQSLYVYNVHISNCAGASAVTAAAPTSLTTTNLGGGTTPAWQVGSGVTAGVCTEWSDTYPTGLKANTPGTAVTFVLPTFATNQTVRVQVAAASNP
jgi:hypothetical protein